MRLFATFLFTSLAVSASALPRMKVADILAKDADEISACGKCELEVQVAFVPPWVRNAFVATDVGDADGHALYFTTFTEPQPGKFDMVEPGDVVTVVGTPDPMLLEPGIDLQSDEFVSQSTESLLRSICRAASVPGRTKVRSFLRGLPVDLPIRVKRDLLAIASEAIGNAVKHGGAANVIVVSEGDGAGAFTIDVLNDGEPFSADAAPGPEKGHFGISNMRERAARSGMTLTFGEKRGYVAVTLTRRK